MWAIEVPWNRATRVEARDFSRWRLVAGKQPRPHWRRPNELVERSSRGKAYAPSVRAHSETVLRCCYDFHLAAGSGPIMNPFPLDRPRRGRRVNADHNPMESYHNQRTGLYRPKVPSRLPRSITDEEFNEIFARLASHRDRALVAFYVCTGARASELLSASEQVGLDGGGNHTHHVVADGSGRRSSPASCQVLLDRHRSAHWSRESLGSRVYSAATDLFLRRNPGIALNRSRTCSKAS